MHFFSEFFTLVKLSYIHNSKSINSFFSSLKFFFERELKLNSSFADLGNVFRNSKWADLKAINIKFFFTKTWFNALLSVVFFIVMLILVLGKTKSNEYLGSQPIFKVFDYGLCEVSNHLQDFSNLVLVLAISFKIYFNSLLKWGAETALGGLYTSFFFGLKGHTNSTDTSRQPTTGLTSSLVGGRFTRSAIVSPPNPKDIHLFYSISRLTRELYFTNNYFKIWLKMVGNGIDNSNSPTSGPYSGLIGRDHPLLHQFSFIPEQHPTSLAASRGSRDAVVKNFFCRNESVYLQTLNNKMFWGFTHFNPSVDLKFIENRTLTPKRLSIALTKNLIPFNFNLAENLRFAKEDRWLSRASMEGNLLTKNSYVISELKQLTGSYTQNTDLLNLNFWAPIKFSSLNTRSLVSKLNAFSSDIFPATSIWMSLGRSDVVLNFALNQPTLPSFNFFELSRLWLSRKYLFTNQPNLNIGLSVNRFTPIYGYSTAQYDYKRVFFLHKDAIMVSLKENILPRHLIVADKSDSSIGEVSELKLSQFGSIWNTQAVNVIKPHFWGFLFDKPQSYIFLTKQNISHTLKQLYQNPIYTHDDSILGPMPTIHEWANAELIASSRITKNPRVVAWVSEMVKVMRDSPTKTTPKPIDNTFADPKLNNTGRQGRISTNYDLRTNLLVRNLFATSNLPFLLTLTSNSYQPKPYVFFFQNQKHQFGNINFYLNL